MLRIGETRIFLLVANYISSLFGLCVRNGANTEDFSLSQQHTDPNEAGDTRQQIQIDMPSISRTQDQAQSHETSPQIPRGMQNDAAAESVVSEAGPSTAQSQNGEETDEESTSEVAGSSPSQNRSRAEDVRTTQQVALWAIEISATGVTAVLAGLIGNQSSSSTHKLFFKGSMISLCVSFAAGSCILVINILRPNNRCFTVAVKILILAALGSVSLAVGFGVTYYLRKA